MLLTISGWKSRYSDISRKTGIPDTQSKFSDRGTERSSFCLMCWWLFSGDTKKTFFKNIIICQPLFGVQGATRFDSWAEQECISGEFAGSSPAGEHQSSDFLQCFLISSLSSCIVVSSVVSSLVVVVVVVIVPIIVVVRRVSWCLDFFLQVLWFL